MRVDIAQVLNAAGIKVKQGTNAAEDVARERNLQDSGLAENSEEDLSLQKQDIMKGFVDKTLGPFAQKLAELNMNVTEESARAMRDVMAENPKLTMDEAAFLASNKLTEDESLMKAALEVLHGGEKTSDMISQIVSALKGEVLKSEVLKSVVPERETVKGEPPKGELPRAEAPRPEPPRSETPRIEHPRVESPRPETSRPESPRSEMPRPEAPAERNNSALQDTRTRETIALSRNSAGEITGKVAADRNTAPDTIRVNSSGTAHLAEVISAVIKSASSLLEASNQGTQASVKEPEQIISQPDSNLQLNDERITENFDKPQQNVDNSQNQAQNQAQNTAQGDGTQNIETAGKPETVPQTPQAPQALQNPTAEVPQQSQQNPEIPQQIPQNPETPQQAPQTPDAPQQTPQNPEAQQQAHQIQQAPVAEMPNIQIQQPPDIAQAPQTPIAQMPNIQMPEAQTPNIQIPEAQIPQTPQMPVTEISQIPATPLTPGVETLPVMQLPADTIQMPQTENSQNPGIVQTPQTPQHDTGLPQITVSTGDGTQLTLNQDNQIIRSTDVNNLQTPAAQGQQQPATQIPGLPVMPGTTGETLQFTQAPIVSTEGTNISPLPVMPGTDTQKLPGADTKNAQGTSINAGQVYNVTASEAGTQQPASVMNGNAPVVITDNIQIPQSAETVTQQGQTQQPITVQQNTEATQSEQNAKTQQPQQPQQTQRTDTSQQPASEQNTNNNTTAGSKQIAGAVARLLSEIPQFQGTPPAALDRFSNMLLRVAKDANPETSAKENAASKEIEQLAAQLEKMFTKIGRKDADSGTRLREAREELFARLTMVQEEISRASQPVRNQLLTQTQKLMDHVRLLNSIDQFVYMQLPVKMSEEERTAELYVFKRKGGKKVDPDNVNILLSIDLEYMGHWEALVNIKGKDVRVNMEVAGEAEKEHFNANTVLLHELLNEEGFKLVDTTIRISQEETTPLTALSALDRYTGAKQGRIDFKW